MLHFRGETLKLIYVTRKAIGGMNSNYFVGQSRNWTTLPGSCIEPFASVGPWEFETVLSKGLQSSCLCGVPGISFLGFPPNRPQHNCLFVTSFSSPPPPSPPRTNSEQMFFLFCTEVVWLLHEQCRSPCQPNCPRHSPVAC